MTASTFTFVNSMLYLLPIVTLLLFNKRINRHFKNQELEIKLPDLMVPYLMVGIHILSKSTFELSVFPYFLIFVFSLGMIILIVTAYKKGEIIYKRFFKTYWRFVFLSSILLYYFLVGANIFSLVIA